MIGEKQVVTDFRRILRHFQKMPSFQRRTSPYRLHVLDQYAVGKKETNQAQIDSMRLLANAYATMVSDIRESKYLRELDTGEKLDPRDKIRATARRVGLSVPRFADEPLPIQDPTTATTPNKQTATNVEK